MTISFSLYSLLFYSALIIAISVIVTVIVVKSWSNKNTKDSMDLEEFIAESIIQLMNGVTTAQEASEVVGGAVNPHLLSTCDNSSVPSVGHGNTTEIKYHLALTKSKSSDGGAKFSVMFGEHGGFGRNKSKHHSDSSVTSMSFAVRVSLPLHDNRATINFSMDELKAVEKVRRTKSKEQKDV